MKRNKSTRNFSQISCIEQTGMSSEMSTSTQRAVVYHFAMVWHLILSALYTSKESSTLTRSIYIYQTHGVEQQVLDSLVLKFLDW